jgi:hypothetical protein
MNKDVTLFISACGRPELLKITLQSFVQFNTYPIKEGIIVEDSGKIGINDFAHDIVQFPLKIIYNRNRMGQMKSIQRGYLLVETNYIFHCEEDWEFYDYSFIEESFKILDLDRNVTSVHLRSYEDQISRYGFDLESNQRETYNIPKTIISSIPNKAAVVFFWNPGLRHRNVFMARIPYSEEEDEATLGYYFHTLGMYSAITKKKEGYVRHIGWDHHVY